MSERSRIRGEAGARLEPSSEDIRRRLEGRAELIEAARARYSELERGLEKGRWKRWLRARPRLVPELLGQEPALAEALARARRRAETEGWPDDTPVMVAVREVTVLRARLERRVRGRLEELTALTGAPSLEADLARVDALVRTAPPVTLEEGEIVVTHMPALSAKGPLTLALIFTPTLLNVLGMFYGAVGVGIGAGILLLVLALLGAWLWRSGELWLTNERLLWKPALGEPVAVRLRSIPDGGIQLGPVLKTVHVAGDRKLHARQVREPAYLAFLLELHRQPPLLGAIRSEERVADVVFYPASLRRDAVWRRGLAVLRPSGISFIPEGRGREAFTAVTGRDPGPRVEVEWLLEELPWLREARLDACLGRVVAATGGVHWPAGDARHEAAVPVWREICIKRWPEEILGKVDWTRQAAAERVLAAWPPEPASPQQ